jgi:uncharacterized protein with NRDE domain
MCILLIAYRSHPRYELIVAANRDEFYARPTAAAAFWSDVPDILAGRDLAHGGTWLGVDRRGRFAALTNVRNAAASTRVRSRGLLVSEYLSGDDGALAYQRALVPSKLQYDGFNLLTADGANLCWWSNHIAEPQVLAPGVYGLSNHLLETPWPKVTRLKAAFGDLPLDSEADCVTSLFRVLRDDARPHDHELPDTGLGLAWERLLSSIFIVGDHYGTRCSSVVLIERGGALRFVERRYAEGGACTGESRFEFESAG